MCFSTSSNDLLTVVAKRVGSVGGAWIGAGAGTPGGRDTFWGIAGAEGIPEVTVIFLIPWWYFKIRKSFTKFFLN